MDCLTEPFVRPICRQASSGQAKDEVPRWRNAPCLTCMRQASNFIPPLAPFHAATIQEFDSGSVGKVCCCTWK